MVTRHTYRCRIALLVGGIALAWSLVATAAPPDIPEFALENPAPGVYVHYGQQAEMSRETSATSPISGSWSAPVA